MVWPAVIAAGAALAGGGLNFITNEKTNRQNRKAQDKDIAYQKEFAQMGIQWKAEDARKAGIHPLAALGAQTHSFTPSRVGASDSKPGRFLAQAGQSLGAGIAQRATPHQKTMFALTQQEAEARIQGVKLDNALKLKSLQPPPGIVEEELYQTLKDDHQYIPGQSTVTQSPGIEKSYNPMIQFYEMPDKTYTMALSQQATEAAENDKSILYDYGKFKAGLIMESKRYANTTYWRSPKKLKFVHFIRKHLPPPRYKGEEYQWNLKKARYESVPISGHLFTNHNIGIIRKRR